MQNSFQLLKSMGKTFKMMSGAIQQRLHNEGIAITKEQGMLLRWLSEKNGVIQNELAWITSRDKTSLTRLLSKMEKSGLITRTTCKEDGRAKRVYLTNFGQETAEKVESVLLSIAEKYLKHISSEHKNTTLKTLEIIQNQLSKDPS